MIPQKPRRDKQNQTRPAARRGKSLQAEGPLPLVKVVRIVGKNPKGAPNKWELSDASANSKKRHFSYLLDKKALFFANKEKFQRTLDGNGGCTVFTKLLVAVMCRKIFNIVSSLATGQVSPFLRHLCLLCLTEKRGSRTHLHANGKRRAHTVTVYKGPCFCWREISGVESKALDGRPKYEKTVLVLCTVLIQHTV